MERALFGHGLPRAETALSRRDKPVHRGKHSAALAGRVPAGVNTGLARRRFAKVQRSTRTRANQNTGFEARASDLKAEGLQRPIEREAAGLPGQENRRSLRHQLAKMRPRARKSRDAMSARHAGAANRVAVAATGQLKRGRRPLKTAPRAAAQLAHAGTLSARSATTFTLRSLHRCFACRSSSFA